MEHAKTFLESSRSLFWRYKNMGEKAWRNRDGEFENDLESRDEMMLSWEKGWETLFTALKHLDGTDFDKTVFIENQSHTLIEAINRKLTHYSSNIGQLIYLRKMLHSRPWQSLSIPKGQSELYRKRKLYQQKNES